MPDIEVIFDTTRDPASPWHIKDSETLLALDWKGEFRIRSVGIGKLGRTNAEFYLLSEPDINGKQATVFVTGSTTNIGLGLPLSETRGTITFSDGHITANPQVFDGRLKIDSIGVQVGPINFGSTTVYMGDAISIEINSYGLDGGISGSAWGHSKVRFKNIFDSGDPQIHRIMDVYKRSK